MNATDEVVGSGKLVDVEVRVLRRHEDSYPVEITVTAGSEQQRLEFRGSLDSSIASWVSTSDPHADGAVLYETLLKDGALRDAWGQARGKSENRRVRLRIDPEAAELNVLPWELIRESGDPLSAVASTPFSRYLPVKLPWVGPEDEYPVRILVVISNPTNLEQYQLGKVEVGEERSVLEQATAEMGPSVQVDFMTENVTLEALEARLRRGKGYHVLHFIGHGKYNKDRAQAMLFFQDDTGCVRLVSDDSLVGMLARLPARPMLVFLVACQSAVVDTKVAFSGLAPRLVEVGVPAVIAMQDIVSIDTARKLEGTFYQRLAEHRQVDLALNEARATLLTAGRLDAGTPVLYMRLRSGTLWGKGSDSNARGALLGSSEMPAAFWNNLCKLIRQNNVVPVLGPRVQAQWLPTPWKVAEEWADANEYPFKSRDEISRVAQYLQISGLDDNPGSLYIETLTDSFRRALPPEFRKGNEDLSLSELVEKSGWGERLHGYPNEIHRVLAGFNTLDLYLTTNPDNLLYEALKAAGRNPKRDYCRWNNELGPDDPMWSAGYAPAPESPLVYHLLGSDIDPTSVVLTEDHYFRYMSSLSEHQRIPSVVWASISTRPLMFIGYSLYDWEFRVLLYQIVARKDKRNSRWRSIAVQLEFKEAAGVNEATVRSFLEKYLSTNKITVYWGSTEQFMAELREEMEKGPQE